VVAVPGAASEVVEPGAAAAAVEPEAVSVVVEPGAAAAAVEPGAVSVVVEPEDVAAAAVPGAASVVVEPEDVAAAAVPEAVSAVAAPEAVSAVAAPEAVSAVAVPEAVSAVAVPEAVSADIAAVLFVLLSLSAAAVEAYSSSRPRFFVFPSAGYSASSSSSVELCGEVSADIPTGVHASYGPGNILSSPGPHQNKSLEYYYNGPRPGYNTVIDTNGLPMDATTTHSRKTGPH